MTIRVLSFDFDGCLFHTGYSRSDDKDVIKHNKVFLDKLIEENKAYSKVYTFVGSNRQSVGVDLINAVMGGSGSCFPAIKQVSDYLGTILDTFLLADIFGYLAAGTSYARGLDKSFNGEHSEWLFDETKVTLLYAQVHKIALENPDEEIVFDFFDDRGNGARINHDILEKLRDFYTTYYEILPPNVVAIGLHQYAGKAVTTVATIRETGLFIDENYRQTVIDLSDQAMTSHCDGIHQPLYVADYAVPKALENRKAFVSNQFQTETASEDDNSESSSNSSHADEEEFAFTSDDFSRVANALSSLDEDFNEIEGQVVDEKELLARAKFDEALKGILQKSVDLDLDGDKIYDKNLPLSEQEEVYLSYKNAAQDARTLHTALKEASEQYYLDGDKAAFKKAADSAIREARDSELKNHRGYLKEVFGYAGLAVLALLTVATAGLAYAVAGGLNYAINRQFFFSTTINTDSINKVDTLEEAVDALTLPAA